MKHIMIATILALVFIVPTQVQATGLLARVAANRAAIRSQQVQVQKVVVQRQNNHHVNQLRVQRVVVDRYSPVVQRSVVVQRQRQLRVVEVPNLHVQNNVLLVRDKYGRVVEVRRQNVLNVQRGVKQVQKGSRIIIQQNRGY